ncbi:MAG: PEP-CTERM sorting domain-containing protein [Planctomycetaceae bacterium]|nr:PEP-CTERM sorting domain-containing protein [Planctomycetaceae bacterium]
MRGDFQLGLSGSVGGNNEAANFNFANVGTSIDLNNGPRTITLGTSGFVTFGQTIRNGSLTLNRLDSASAGQFTFSGSNTITALTLDSVKLAATTSNFALGSGTVTLTGANPTTLNIQGARTFSNAFSIADSAGTKTITGDNNNSLISGTITNNDTTGGLVIGAQHNANGNWNTADTSGGQYLVFNPASGQLAIVPEPSTWVMAAIGAGLGPLKARRRKRAEASLAA